MPIITIVFEHNDACAPKYKFGDHVAVTDNCQPKDWLIGEVIGLYLESGYESRWWYAVKLDCPLGLTEEYCVEDLVPATEVRQLQTEWELGEAAWLNQSDEVANNHKPLPKFQPGNRVKFTQETGCSLPGNFALVMDSRYVSGEDWSGWVYKLASEHLTEPLEIGEIWLEPQAACIAR